MGNITWLLINVSPEEVREAWGEAYSEFLRQTEALGLDFPPYPSYEVMTRKTEI